MTCASRQSEPASRRLANAETVVLAGSRAKTEAEAPRLQLAGVASAPRAVIRIDRPGTYRLASDVTGAEMTVGILILSDHVTLDLAGFNVVGKPGSLTGIRVLGTLTNVTVRNGTVRGWEGHGVDLGDASESSVEELRVTGNAGDGIRLGANCRATEVETWGNARDGLAAGDGVVACRCAARSNSAAGFRLGDSAFVEDCVAVSNSREGLVCGAAAVIRECIARHNHASGVVVGDLGAVRACELIRNDDAAIRAGADAVVTDNRCLAAGSDQVIVTGPGSTLANNIGAAGRAA